MTPRRPKPPDKLTPDEARWLLREALWSNYCNDKGRAYDILGILASKLVEYHEEHEDEKEYERFGRDTQHHWW